MKRSREEEGKREGVDNIGSLDFIAQRPELPEFIFSEFGCLNLCLIMEAPSSLKTKQRKQSKISLFHFVFP